jgi:hypothetical protein
MNLGFYLASFFSPFYRAFSKQFLCKTQSSYQTCRRAILSGAQYFKTKKELKWNVEYVEMRCGISRTDSRCEINNKLVYSKAWLYSYWREKVTFIKN